MVPRLRCSHHLGRPRVTASPRVLLGKLSKAYPDWGPTLEFSTPFELLVATILAAQARDERINQVTGALFKKYRGPADYVRAKQSSLEADLRATGFFRQKARTVKAVSRSLLDEFAGEVPADMESLTRLKGVGRKTASIVLGNAFGIPAIAVDRHVARVAGRLGLTTSDDPERIEEDLRGYFARKEWVKATWCLVLHGRRVCTPTPRCPQCPVHDLCPYPRKTTS